MNAPSRSISAGHVHAASTYGSDDELVDLVGAFIDAAHTVGEPVFVRFGPRNTALIRAGVGEIPGLTFLEAPTSRARPAQVLKLYVSRYPELLAGATPLRIVGELPHPGTGAPWDPWCRYEAATNHLMRNISGQVLCVYDTRVAPSGVLSDVERTHPYLASPDGHLVRNHRYETPETFLAARSAPPDPLESQAPVVELHNPDPRAARAAVLDPGRRTGLDHGDLDDLVIAVSEAVTNAIVHGVPPVALRAWSSHDRVVACISDCGDGPTDPFVGLLPRGSRREAGGLGLWLAEQLCAQVTYARTAEGFTVRLIAGQPEIR